MRVRSFIAAIALVTTGACGASPDSGQTPAERIDPTDSSTGADDSSGAEDAGPTEDADTGELRDCEGDFSVTDDIAACKSITGTLSMLGLTIRDLEDHQRAFAFPNLVRVGALDIRDGNEVGLSLSLPNLETVDGVNVDGHGISASYIDLDKLSFPRLATIKRGIRIGGGDSSGTRASGTLSLPALKTMGATLIHHTLDLNLIDLPALESVESIRIEMNRALTMIEMPSLVAIGDASKPRIRRQDERYDEEAAVFVVRGNKVLAKLMFPQLMVIRDDLEVLGDDRNGGKNSALTSVVMPKLTAAGSVGITYNEKLMELSLPALEAVESLSLGCNPVLPAEQVEAIVDQLPNLLPENNFNNNTCL